VVRVIEGKRTGVWLPFADRRHGTDLVGRRLGAVKLA
jgi:hypothetical protein